MTTPQASNALRVAEADCWVLSGNSALPGGASAKTTLSADSTKTASAGGTPAPTMKRCIIWQPRIWCIVKAALDFVRRVSHAQRRSSPASGRKDSMTTPSTPPAHELGAAHGSDSKKGQT